MSVVDSPDDNFANLARADCNHDFGPLGVRSTKDTVDVAFRSGLLGTSNENWDEDESMSKTLGKSRVEWLPIPKGLPEVTANVYPHNTTVTIREVAFLGVSPAPQGEALVNALGIQDSLLCVDFNHHGFLSKLKRGPPSPLVNVGYIYSAATVNDPASKTPPEDAIFDVAKSPNGVNVKSYTQTSGAITFPGGKPYTEGSPVMNFISKYDVTLSGIVEKKSFGKRKANTVTLTFAQGSKIATISDSKGQNSPTQLGAFIEKLKALLGVSSGAVRDKNNFELSTKWQQKRSGDWLQAIHAATLDSMTFNPALPLNKRVFFVSHDRIAIAYALRLKVNCLFFSGNNIYTFTFGNVAPSVDPEISCAEQLRTIAADYTQVNTWWDAIQAQVKIKQGITSTAIDTAAASLATAKTAAELQTAITSILTNAVVHAHTGSLLPTVPLSTEGKNCEKLMRYYTLKTLKEKHKNAVFIPPTLIDSFKTKSTIYLSAAEYKILPTRNLVSRMFSIAEDSRDNFIFFPFLQNSLDTGRKTVIRNAFAALEARLTDAVLLTIAPGTGRNKSVLVEKLKLNVKSLFTQAYIFLKDDTATPADSNNFNTNLNAAQGLPTSRGVKPDTTSGDDTSVQFDVANQLAVANVISSKQTLQQVTDDVLEGETAVGGAKQKGGWEVGGQVRRVVTIDHNQCADPILYAMIDAGSRPISVLTEQEDLKARQERGDTIAPVALQGGRRPLYGGSTTMTTTVEPTVSRVSTPAQPITPADIINICILLVVTRITRDSWKLGDAPSDVLEYYYKGTKLLSLLLDIEKTDATASAVRDLTTQSMFMTNDDIATAFSIDADTASVYRLFFSALEENPLLEAPENPAQFLRDSKDLCTQTWNAIGEIPPTISGETIRALAESITQKITAQYAVQTSTIPGVGQVLQPGIMSPTKPKELREARLGFFDKTIRKGGRRRHRTRRATTP